MMTPERLRSLSVEEVANSLTHGFGLLFSIAGFVFLLALAITKGDVWHIASAVVYGPRWSFLRSLDALPL